jgi:5-methylcytosine-specific restriction endonuclease McrBC regulatory subunit McrC
VRLSAEQQVYPCDEHGTVPVPISELVTDGKLDIYPGITGHGYFDIDYTGGALVLRASKYVGLIPISDRVAIHVRPKAPIANLMWLVWRAGGAFKQLEGIVRGYQALPGEIDDPEKLYVDVFASALERLYRGGMMKRYVTSEADNVWRGRLSLARSISRHYSRGRRYAHTFATTDLTLNNAVNQIVKHTAGRLLPHLQRDRGAAGQKLADRMQRCLQPLSTVDDSHITPSVIAAKVPGLVRSLPPVYREYESALWLAYLIASRSGVVMEQVGNARFESVLINVSEVFEKYVRLLCVEARPILRCRVYDGNKRPIRLFVDKSIPAAPDIYFARDGVTLAIADAKYKKKIDREDRYELIAHCNATEVRRAAFICPSMSDEPRVAHYGTLRDGVRISIIQINLAAADMRAEEALFMENVSELVNG